MPKPKEPKDKNSKLMKECGAKPPYQWEPEPTDHIRYQMNLGDWVSQVVGWVKWHTVKGSKSAWAMRDGRLLTIKHAALDLGWSYQVAINRFYAVEVEGLIRIEKSAKKVPGRIGLCADVPKSRRKKGELNKLVQNAFPAQLIEKIEALSAIERKQFEVAYEMFEKWSKEMLTDTVNAARTLRAQVEDNLFQAFCLARQRKNKNHKRKTGVRVELPELPDFVHLVQNREDANCTKPKNGSVQNENGVHVTESKTTPAPSDTDSVNRESVGRQANAGEACLPATPLSEKATRLREMLTRVLARKLKTPPGDRLVFLVLRKMGTATVEDLEQRILSRIEGINTYGLVPGLAEDVAQALKQPGTPNAPLPEKDRQLRERLQRQARIAHALKGDKIA